MQDDVPTENYEHETNMRTDSLRHPLSMDRSAGIANLNHQTTATNQSLESLNFIQQQNSQLPIQEPQKNSMRPNSIIDEYEEL